MDYRLEVVVLRRDSGAVKVGPGFRRGLPYVYADTHNDP